MAGSTIQELLNSSFYLLESPSDGRIRLGAVSQSRTDVGSFLSYDLMEEVFLEEPTLSVSREELLDFLKSEEDVTNPRLVWRAPSENDYQKRFKNIHKKLKDKEIEKAVLYSFASSELAFDVSNVKALLKRALLNSISGCLYGFFNFERSRGTLGFAPEYLFKEEDGKIITLALAGTSSSEEGMLENSKLVEEHSKVKIGIERVLDEKVSWSDTSVSQKGGIYHLCAEGEFKVKKLNALSRLLHPTPAVGVLPQQRSFELDLGPVPRGFYGGYGELFAQGESFSLVLLRGIEWSSRSKVTMFMGGGVVSESVYEDEWAEVLLKYENLKSFWESSH